MEIEVATATMGEGVWPVNLPSFRYN